MKRGKMWKGLLALILGASLMLSISCGERALVHLDKARDPIPPILHTVPVEGVYIGGVAIEAKGTFMTDEDTMKLLRYLKELQGAKKESDKIIDRANDLLAK